MLKEADAKCAEHGIPMYNLGGFGGPPTVGASQAAGAVPAAVTASSHPQPAFSPAVPEAQASDGPATLSFDEPEQKSGPGLIVKKAPASSQPKFASAAKTTVVKPKVVQAGLDDDFDDWFNELDEVEAKAKEQKAQAKAAPKPVDLAATIAAAKPIVKKAETQTQPQVSKAPINAGGSGYASRAPAQQSQSTSSPVKTYGLFTNNNSATAVQNQSFGQNQTTTGSFANKKGISSEDLFAEMPTDNHSHQQRMQQFNGSGAISSDAYFGRENSKQSSGSWGDADWQSKKEEAIDKAKEVGQQAYEKGNELFNKYFR